MSRSRAKLEALAASPLVDGERPSLKTLLDDAAALVEAQRIAAAVETLSSGVPGVIALSRSASGWDDTGKGTGKHIDDLSKEWEEVGRKLKVDRLKFPVTRPKDQSAFVRAMAEQSFGQIDEHYAVAVDYGRFSGVSSGAYYLGRAEGQMEWALTLSGVRTPEGRTVADLSALTPFISRVEDDIVAAYAKPGSTAQHTNFILANSSLKLAKELDRHSLRFGALTTLLRSLFSLSLATLPKPSAEDEAVLMQEAEQFAKRLATSKRDESIGEAFVEKARISLEKCRAGGESADRERLRAAALLGVVIPRYIEIMEGSAK